MSPRRRRAIECRSQREFIFVEPRERPHAADGFYPAAPSVESRRHELRRAIWLQSHRRHELRFLDLDLRLRRFGNHERQFAFARQRHESADERPVQNLRRRSARGAWPTSNMTQRVTAPVSGETPQYIADYYYAKVSAISNAFVDYYVSATDTRGNTYKSPIQHVYVGAGSGSGGGSGGGGNSGPVTVSPVPTVAGNSVTIQYVASGRAIASANPVY